jgi:hypothetical protein
MTRAAAVLLALTAIATAALAQAPAARVADDAKVLDRVAAASKKDLPRDLLRRIVDEDIDLLRGKRSDGTYEYAGYERIEAARVTDSFSVEARGDDDFSRLELRADNAYRVVISLPSRRMLVTKNRRLWVERADIESIPHGSTTARLQSVKIGAWFEPGTSRNIDLDDIARQATVRLFARGDKDSGYGNIVLSIVQAKIYDNPDSPYADAVASLKAIQRALDRGDVPSIRSMAARVSQSLGRAEAAPVRSIDVIAPRAETASIAAPAASPASASAASAEILRELQEIEDLLTGSEAERRVGNDRLHQLVRRLRASK